MLPAKHEKVGIVGGSLPDLLAAAWDDGQAACIEAHGRIKPVRPNPYRPETITRDATGAEGA